mgnify:FL=1
MKQHINIGLIGLGQRGIATLARYQCIPNARVTAISDLRQTAIDEALRLLPPEERSKMNIFPSSDGWQQLCQQPDIDIVFICTDWKSHTPIAVHAMQQGKDVAIEVPAATTVEECWQLVETSNHTQRICTMLENCCYDTFHLGLMEMHRRGFFGEITHCEGAYIHDLRADHGWMSYIVSSHGGNPYPTHGLGPACQLLGINGTDRLVSLTSMSSPNKGNSTLLQTALGKTVLLQFDERTPRPYSRLQTLCGTKGYAQKYPLPTLQFDGEEVLLGQQAVERVERYHDEKTRLLIEQGKRLQVSNLMNYIMDCRLMEALRTNRQPDISVFDAALWSSIAELSARSALNGGKVVEIPDFIN